MLKMKTLSALLIIILAVGCTPLQSTYKSEPTTRAGICYDKYIAGELLSAHCERAVSYGQKY